MRLLTAPASFFFSASLFSLTIGELMITNARVLLLDEPTTGLDA